MDLEAWLDPNKDRLGVWQSLLLLLRVLIGGPPFVQDCQPIPIESMYLDAWQLVSGLRNLSQPFSRPFLFCFRFDPCYSALLFPLFLYHLTFQRVPTDERRLAFVCGACVCVWLMIIRITMQLFSGLCIPLWCQPANIELAKAERWSPREPIGCMMNRVVYTSLVYITHCTPLPLLSSFIPHSTRRRLHHQKWSVGRYQSFRNKWFDRRWSISRLKSFWFLSF